MFKNVLILILAAIALVSSYLNISYFQKDQKANTVKEVSDGDTFQLYSGKRVRLMGVNVPEYNRCGGPEARKRLTELILNKPVRLAEETEETFGRSLALVYQGDTLINLVMMKEGWGRADYRANSHRSEITQAFHEAQTAKRGIWSSLCREALSSTPPSPNCNIKGNIDKNSYDKFYHLPGCLHYNEIVIEKDIGEGWFCSEAEAQKAGFKKASSCP
ncbi:thermonuclease family protein [Candidatus Roizmanbacteria bacterium]|nr:thermonuclease family protein [Candidatus Roizmanbacteria bacterium]